MKNRLFWLIIFLLSVLLLLGVGVMCFGLYDFARQLHLPRRSVQLCIELF